MSGALGVRGPCPPAIIEAIASGLVIEPLAHPKPGSVTRLVGHADKDIFDFALNAFIVSASMHEACRASLSRCQGSIAEGFRFYRGLRRRWKRGVNISLGSILLYMPVASSLSRGFEGARSLLSRASNLVARCTGREEAVEYYKLLEEMRPSHLRSYKGPVPGVGSGEYPSSFLEVLESARWDHVHRELLEGYPLTGKALTIIEREAGDSDIETALLKSLVELLASHGDTLIAAKHGYKAYIAALKEAKTAAKISEKIGVRKTLEWLDSLWRPRGWNPGALLDIISLASGLYIAENIIASQQG